MKKYVALLFLATIIGCGTLPISEREVKSFSRQAGSTVEHLSKAPLTSLAPAPGLGEGLAGALGGAVTLATAFTLNKLRKKQKDKFKKNVEEIAKGSS